MLDLVEKIKIVDQELFNYKQNLIKNYTPEQIINEAYEINFKEQIRDIVEFAADVDQRLGADSYFVKTMKLLQKIFDSPELLEEDANEKIEETNK